MRNLPLKSSIPLPRSGAVPSISRRSAISGGECGGVLEHLVSTDTAITHLTVEGPLRMEYLPSPAHTVLHVAVSERDVAALGGLADLEPLGVEQFAQGDDEAANAIVPFKAPVDRYGRRSLGFECRVGRNQLQSRFRAVGAERGEKSIDNRIGHLRLPYRLTLCCAAAWRVSSPGQGLVPHGEAVLGCQFGH